MSHKSDLRSVGHVPEKAVAYRFQDGGLAGPVWPDNRGEAATEQNSRRLIALDVLESDFANEHVR